VSSDRRTSTSFADRQKSPKRRIRPCSSAPATRLLPAESSLPYSANSHHWLLSAG
jgi:hypothetical protein